MFLFVLILLFVVYAAVNAVFHRVDYTKRKKHRVLIKNDLNDNGIWIAEQFIRGGISATLLDYSGRKKNEILNEADGQIKTVDQLRVKCMKLPKYEKIKVALDLLEGEIGRNLTIIDAACIEKPIALPFAWWMFAVQDAFNGMGNAFIFHGMQRVWHILIFVFHHFAVRSQRPLPIEDSRTPVEFKLEVNGSLKEVFNVYSPQKSPLPQETPKTSHPNINDHPSSTKPGPSQTNNVFVFGASNDKSTPQVTPESTENNKSGTSIDSIANISINEELQRALGKIKSSDGISPTKSFNDTASTIESDAILLVANGQVAAEPKGIFDGPMRSNTLGTNKFSTLNLSNLASQAMFFDNNPTSTVNDAKETQPSIFDAANEVKINFSSAIDPTGFNTNSGRSEPTRRAVRTVRRIKTHTERNIS